MAEVKTQAQNFKEIADAIRVAKEITLTSEINKENKEVFYGTFSANNFATEIRKLTLNMTAPPVYKFENGYYGIRAAKCAATYLWTRVMGVDKFAYRTNSIFSGIDKNKQNYVRVTAIDSDEPIDADTPIDPDTATAYNYACIDCSTFVSLCLRGIPYEKSPYYLHKGENEKWTPSAELSGMYGEEGWEFREIDTQPEGVFNDIGIPEQSSVRLAASLGQYFHRYGYILYDSAVNGKLATDDKGFPMIKSNEGYTKLDLQAGDLVFWDTKDDAQVDSRYRSISHVAIVSERPDYYYHVTGDTKKVGQLVVWYEKFAETEAVKDSNGNITGYKKVSHPNSAMVLAVRPDYRHGMSKEETPIGINLVSYPWVYSRLKTTEKNGLTVSLLSENEIKVSGTATENTTLHLNYLTLSPGAYKLTGIEGFTGTYFALQVRLADGTDFAPKAIRYPTGTDATNEFVLTEETEVNVRLYISNGKSLTDARVVPTLIRIKEEN